MHNIPKTQRYISPLDRTANIYGIIHVLFDVLDGYCMEFNTYAPMAAVELSHRNKQLLNRANQLALSFRTAYNQFSRSLVNKPTPQGNPSGLSERSELISAFVRLLRCDIDHSIQDERTFIAEIRQLFKEVRTLNKLEEKRLKQNAKKTKV